MGGGDLRGRGRELEIANGDTEEWKDAQTQYERPKGYLERGICLIIGFGN